MNLLESSKKCCCDFQACRYHSLFDSIFIATKQLQTKLIVYFLISINRCVKTVARVLLSVFKLRRRQISAETAYSETQEIILN